MQTGVTCGIISLELGGRTHKRGRNFGFTATARFNKFHGVVEASNRKESRRQVLELAKNREQFGSERWQVLLTEV